LHLNFSSNYAMLLLFFKSISMETICYWMVLEKF
jgi:hypothetical protein